MIEESVEVRGAGLTRSGVTPAPTGVSGVAEAVLRVVRRHRALQGALLLGPVALWMVAFVAGPAVFTVLMSLWRIDDFSLVHSYSLASYSHFFTNSLYTDTLLRSAKIAAIVTGLAVTLATPVAYVIAFKIRRHRTLWFGAVVVALWVGYLLRVYAWRIVLGQQGVLNGILQWAGIVDHPVKAFLFNDFALVLALTHLCTPFALVPIYAVFEQIPRRLHDAAADLYAPGRKVFLNVTLPLGLHGILAGASFAFIISFGDYFAPTLIGGPGGSMIANLAASQFGVAFQWPLGAAIGVVMFAVVLLVLTVPVLITALLTRRARRATYLVLRPEVEQAR